MSSLPPQPAPDIATALESYVSTRPSRAFGVKETALALAVAGVVAVALDSEGLLAWARRLEVGHTQAALLQALVPLNGSLAKWGAGAPRQWAARQRDRLTRALGGEGDPLLSEGWVAVAPSPAVAPVPVSESDSGKSLLSPTLSSAGGEGGSEPEPAPEEPDLPGGGVLLLGDSMIAGSLGATLERTLARSSGLRVTRAAQLGTGLARPDVYDWMKVVPALLQRERPRFVVVSLGANDATNLRDGDEQVDYGDPRWRQVYGARVEAMMRALTGADTRVLWLTLPPMRDRRLSARGAYLNGIFAQCARKVPRVEFLELDVLVGNRERQYATFVQAADGRLLRYRLDDGVHLAPAGSRAVAGWVLDWLRERRR